VLAASGENILAESGGRYSLGERGEKLHGWRSFAELYAVSSRRMVVRVLWVSPRAVRSASRSRSRTSSRV
jgi:hypothetical protein